MRRSRLYIIATIVVAGFAGPTHAIVLWQVENNNSPTMVPSYSGQPSPFPQPKLEVTAAVVTDEAAQAAALRQQALVKARRLIAPEVALQLNSAQLQVKGMTNGGQGLRILVDNAWVGLNETIRVSYAINPQTTAALEELQTLDADSARRLQEKLQGQRIALERDGVQITAVNSKGRQLTLKTPQGIKQIPLILEP
jgi:hypothetical protein